jgi:hypothetical protein
MNGDHTSDSSARSLSPGIASLANLGNTCFLNSVLYTLRFTPGFCHSLHHLNQDLQAKARLENGRQKAADSDQEHLLEVIHTLHHLFQKLCSSDACSGDPKVTNISFLKLFLCVSVSEFRLCVHDADLQYSNAKRKL